eukprot:gnl/TRDRNA2_/TRDRNA2_181709_c0_seq1.p1 gnl/TRDRNA2_/TRDRNA2_181709_c0~~gnl/TRDRNA2_/TRDRNA2_181709_c0_seq1.p1  ORF type:complete len:439 (-),score=65.13 gnl/TRDRNA2_/TRDRNA2_181709_c0_seq1:67-1383(-)
MAGAVAGPDVASRYQFWPHSAAFAVKIAPGAANGFYVALVGFYVGHFASPAFFCAMLFCLYLPAIFVSPLQRAFDSLYDEKFSTRTTYFFRVVFMQVIMGMIVILWMLVPQSPYVVLGMGMLLGASVACICSSADQFVAAMHPTLLAVSMFGNILGAALPVLMFFILGFSPSSSLLKFRLALATIPVLCLLVSAYLSWLHFKLNVFDTAYMHLAYDLPSSAHSDGGLGASSSQGSLHAKRGPGDVEKAAVDESAPLVSKDPAVPNWIWIWCGTTGLINALSLVLLTFCAFYGDPRLAQLLALSKLLMDVLGSLAAVPVHHIPGFNDGPWHIFLTVSVLAITAMLGLHAAVLAGVHVERPIFLFTWCLAHGWHAFLMPFIGITVGLYAPIVSRKSVERTNTFALFVGTVVGIVFAAAVLIPLAKLGTAWPQADVVIREQ